MPRFKRFKRRAPLVRRAKKTRLVKTIKRVVNRQKAWKCIDFAYSNQGMNTTGKIDSIAPIVRQAGGGGTGISDKSRVSNKVRIMRITYDLRVIAGQSNAALTADLYNSVRIVIGRYSDAASNLNSVGQILNITASPATDPKDPYDKRFKWLRDLRGFVHPVAPGTSSTYNASTSVRFRGTIKKSWILEFNGDSAANDVWGMPYSLLYSDSSALPNPFVTGYYRIWYTDV